MSDAVALPTLTCEQCAKPFQGTSERKFCTIKCQGLAYSARLRSAPPVEPRQYAGKKRQRINWQISGDFE